MCTRGPVGRRMAGSRDVVVRDEECLREGRPAEDLERLDCWGRDQREDRGFRPVAKKSATIVAIFRTSSGGTAFPPYVGSPSPFPPPRAMTVANLSPASRCHQKTSRGVAALRWGADPAAPVFDRQLAVMNWLPGLLRFLRPSGKEANLFLNIMAKRCERPSIPGSLYFRPWSNTRQFR